MGFFYRNAPIQQSTRSSFCFRASDAHWISPWKYNRQSLKCRFNFLRARAPAPRANIEGRQAMKGGRIQLRRRAFAAFHVALLAIFLAVCPSAGRAQDMSALYQATAIVTGTDMRSRPTGFAQCLRDVLVKVSGEPRLRNDPRVADLAAHPDTLFTSFNYVDQMAGKKVHDDQGTYDRSYNLTVNFDPARIDKALMDLGDGPWRGERPVIVPVLTVHGFAASYLLSAESPAGAEQRAAFASVARDYGLAVRFPTDAEFAAWGVTLDQVPSVPAASSPGDARVAGALAFDRSLPGWVGSWQMRSRGVDYEWRIADVNYDEAFRDIVRGVLRVASGHGAPD
jgi:uncharacterized protein